MCAVILVKKNHKPHFNKGQRQLNIASEGNTCEGASYQSGCKTPALGGQLHCSSCSLSNGSSAQQLAAAQVPPPTGWNSSQSAALSLLQQRQQQRDRSVTGFAKAAVIERQGKELGSNDTQAGRPAPRQRPGAD